MYHIFNISDDIMQKVKLPDVYEKTKEYRRGDIVK